ncbi:MAG: superoxide dismutase [Polyangia bacterium]|jgi:Fe-Mn family superoxide dismutase|nr:superoxide dismutase [Polyangia bacterium]
MHKLPDLTYDFGALEPHIDARTMEIHHGKHHAAYVSNLNAALETAGGPFGDWPLERILTSLGELPEAERQAVRNNGGGHYNHSLFWSVLGPGKGGKPSGALAKSIEKAFGGFEAFTEKLGKAAITRFGSGWAWLSVKGGDLLVSSTPNQDNPIMDGSGIPILGLDVWEHAYYLQYQNRRPDYVKAWWNLVDWEAVGKRYSAALEKR